MTNTKEMEVLKKAMELKEQGREEDAKILVKMLMDSWKKN